MRRLVTWWIALSVLASWPACRTATRCAPPVSDPAAAPELSCPPEAPAPPQLPFEEPLHRVADFWLAKAQEAAGGDAPGVDEPLVTAEEIAAHNERMRRLSKDGWPTGRWDLLRRSLDHAQLAERLRAQLERLRAALASKRLRVGRAAAVSGSPVREASPGRRRRAAGHAPEPSGGGASAGIVGELARRVLEGQPSDELRVAWRSTPLRCMPTRHAMFDDQWLYPFDAMQCSQLRAGEPVRVVRKAPGYWLVWASYGDGWVDPRALTPPLAAEEVERYLEPRRFAVVDRDRLALRRADDGALLGVVRLGARLPVAPREDGTLVVLAPGPRGLVEARAAAGPELQEGYPPLTRAALYRLAFSLLDSPYGWGGMGDHRDCSRMLMDLFAVFGVQLPRNSGQQAKAGIEAIDVAGLADGAKAQAIERAARRGVVLLYLPGHIMLYVGRDGEQLFALHQFSGYLVPCGGGGETMYRVNRAAVTSLELGRGSSRHAFLQRITRLVVFGAPAVGDGSGAAPDAGVRGAH